MKHLSILLSIASVASLMSVACGAPTDDVGGVSETAQSVESFDSFTPRWGALLSCDDGAAVLDVAVNERRLQQFVVRSDEVKARFSPFFSVPLVPKRDLIVRTAGTPVSQYQLDFGDPTGPKLVNRKPTGVFLPQDFSFMIGEATPSISVRNSTAAGRFFSVYREGDGVVLELQELALRGCAGTVRPRGCGESGNNQACGFFCDGPDYTSRSVLASWRFGKCKAL